MPKSRKSADFRIVRAAVPGVQAVEARSDHVFARHSHDQYGVGLMLAGGQTSSSGRGQVEALAGDIITVNPGEVHDGAPLGGAPRAWRMLYLPPHLAGAVAADLSEGARRDYTFHQPVAHHAALAACFGRLYAAVTGDATDLLREQLLIELLQGLQGEAPRAGATSATAAIARARAMIDDAPAAAPSLADLAAVSGLSRFQLVRQFARATGLTPHAYLIQRRIDAARALLARGAALADAAAASGFADQSHMTRLFIRTYGITPGAYAAISFNTR
ncbi:AraC family transcriptional regulator [Massilia sp. JS1662]|nr:AraC family transcriptional regulator [Massilia sp. JS1662]KGF82652.1 AraC family transcriptional regulator [Massilia sp. JS1662]